MWLPPTRPSFFSLKVRAFNTGRRELSVVAAQEAREQDLALLDYAIQKDKAGEAEERAKREEEKRVSKLIKRGRVVACVCVLGKERGRWDYGHVRICYQNVALA